MIKMLQRPDEASRSPDKSCRWIAECDHDGEHYEARARLDAPNALARLLVDVGVAEQPVVLITAGVRGEMRYRSLHAMAKRTIKESATQPVGQALYRDFPGTVWGKQAIEAADPEILPWRPNRGMKWPLLMTAALPGF